MASPETLILPGSVCPHTHLRAPSPVNLAESFTSGTLAALYGGYVKLDDMPNTPGRPTWTLERVEEKELLVVEDSYLPMGIIAGSQPESDNVGELARMAPRVSALKFYSAPTTGSLRDYAASDFLDGAQEFHRVAPDKPIMLHAGKENLEDMIGLVVVDLGHHLHICHVNDPRDVRLIQKYKDAGYKVTCGVTPHHLFKNSHAVQTEGWFARMQPPLALQTDAEELFRQLVEGLIDMVESDHAPHTFANKWKAEEQNPAGIHDAEHTTCFGVPNIEFVMPLLLYQLKRGRISLERLKQVTTYKPAELLGVQLSEEDTSVEWEMGEYRIEDETLLKSGVSWTPFLGMLAVGEVRNVRIGGQHIFQNGKVLQKAGRVISARGEVI